MLIIYRFLGRLAGPLVILLLRYRLRHGKEDPKRWREKLGRTNLARPNGKLLWLHAASIGEALSALPLIEALHQRFPDVTMLCTTGTQTSAQLMAERLPIGALHQFAPVDLPAVASRFLQHWQPSLVLWLESELWATQFAAIKARGIPLVLINGRLSPRSYQSWQIFPQSIRSLLGYFDLILAQSEADAERFHTLGAADPQFLGNLKEAASPLPYDAAKLAQYQVFLQNRPLWLAASTHDGEEFLIAKAHQAIRAYFPTLITLIVPRHPARGEAIVTQLARLDVTIIQRSRMPAFSDIGDTDAIYIADTLGELGLWYRLAPIVFIGGSLIAHGGHNPLEPARLDAALLAGPHIDNFAPICATLVSAGALQIVSAEELAGAVIILLQNPQLQQSRQKKAYAIATPDSAIVDRILDLLQPLLQFE